MPLRQAQDKLSQQPAGRRRYKYESPHRSEGFDLLRRTTLVLGGVFLRGFGFRGVAFRVLAAEALDPAGGVQQLLLAGEEGVAGRTDFDVQVAFVGGASGEIVAAGANHSDFVICGMDSCLHVRGNLDSSLLILQQGRGIQQRAK
jgi:hypothetical protein